MDAVIDSYKPAIRVPAPASMPWATNSQPDVSHISPGGFVAAGSRVVVVAPHPDDEVLAIGATLATLAQLGHSILVIAVTDGEGSHPGSARWSPEALRRVRPLESQAALQRLGIAADMVRLGMPDGGVALHEKELAQLLPLGSTDTVLVPWRHDGHADHEACARATLAACRTVRARCIEFPVWALVPGHPAHERLAGRSLQRVVVPSRFVRAKQAAISAFTSQVQPDGLTPAVLQAQALQTWQVDGEWVFV